MLTIFVMYNKSLVGLSETEYTMHHHKSKNTLTNSDYYLSLSIVQLFGMQSMHIIKTTTDLNDSSPLQNVLNKQWSDNDMQNDII